MKSYSGKEELEKLEANIRTVPVKKTKTRKTFLKPIAEDEYPAPFAVPGSFASFAS